MVRISVIGDYQPTNETHVATTSALQHAGFSQGAPTEVTWVPTERVEVSGVEVLAPFSAP
jgi:CTP synthase (UTP-ammonia lyase)